MFVGCFEFLIGSNFGAVIRGQFGTGSLETCKEGAAQDELLLSNKHAYVLMMIFQVSHNQYTPVNSANPQLVHNWTTSFIHYKLSNIL